MYLVGFMAAGKTTVARALAKRLDWRAIDIDEMVEQRERMPVADIFAKQGEPYFRIAERDVLTDQLGVRHVVVATGGGTFVDPQNRNMINADGLSIGSIFRSNARWRASPWTDDGRWPPIARRSNASITCAARPTSRLTSASTRAARVLTRWSSSSWICWRADALRHPHRHSRES